ncbi:MAG: DUF3299 domain-containing protein [Pseudomonadota bacterium]
MRPQETIARLTAFMMILFCPVITGVHAQSESTLSTAEISATAPSDALSNVAPLPASEATDVVLQGLLEAGYRDDQGRYFVDLFERDQAYLAVRITTPEGRPVVGAVPDIAIEGSSRLVLNELTSSEDGVMQFGVIGGQMGLDTVTASIGDAKVEFAINVISLRAMGFPTVQTVEGGLGWSELMQAQLEYDETGIVATFPDSVKEKAGEQVKISGFMMPLDPDLKQKHFLLTSNPPSCFFHVPGGPAGSVEVLAPEGIEVSWNPVVVEGRFEPQDSSEIGVVYRLLDARLVEE